MKRIKCLYCGKQKTEDKLTPAFNRTQEQLKNDKRKASTKYRCKDSQCWRENT